jgi:Asp-tRNA(Asn)/Glu-tRNA(Gln) amidotransferase A subunit family amidase
MTELCDLPATALRRMIGAKRISPVELLESCVRRIDAVNPRLNAFVVMCLDQARAAAREAEAAVMRGDALGPLHGLPIGMKESYHVQGMATTQGFPAWKDRIAAKDDCTTAAIRRAGAVIVGKTNVPELLQGLASRNRLFGTTRNAYDPERSSLGSSGGSGVAVSASMVPIATGSDTGGSIRGPASANGICGLRPTPGLIANDEHIHAFNPSSVRGPMARSVEDTRLLLAGMVEGDGPDPYRHPVSAADVLAVAPSDLRGLRVAVSCDLGFVKTDPAMRAAFEEKISRIERLFGKVEWRDPPMGEINRAYWILRPLKFFPGLAAMYKQDPPSVTEYKRVDFRRAFAESVEDVAWAQAEQTRVFRALHAFYKEFDLIITPGLSILPLTLAEIDRREQAMRAENDRFKPDEYDFAADAGRGTVNAAFTLTAHPVLTVTAGRGPAGMPFGLNLVGRFRGDLELLSIGLALESAMADDATLARPLPDIAALAEGAARNAAD